MAVQTHCGSFQLSTGVGGTTQAIAGLGFSPIAVIFMINGMPDTTTTPTVSDSMRGCWGMSTGSGDQRCYCVASNDGVTPMVTASGHRTDNAIATIDPSGLAFEGLIGVQSFDVDGFTLVVNQQFATAYTCFYWAIGGDTIVAAKSVTKARGGLGGNASSTAYTGIGFRPDFVFLVGGNFSLTTTSGVAASSFVSIGCASRYGQWDVTAVDHNGGASSSNANYQTNRQQCFYWQNGNNGSSILSPGALQDFGADGFTIGWTSGGPQTAPFLALCIQGGQWAVGSFLSPHTVGNKFSLTSAWQNSGGMLVSGGNTVSLGTTLTNNFVLVGGLFDQQLNQLSMNWKSFNGQNPSSVGLMVDYADVLSQLTIAAAISYEADVVSSDQFGFTEQATSSSLANDFVTYYWIVGPVPPVPIIADQGADFQWLGGDDY